MSAERQTRLLIVASHILGGKSFSTQLVQAARRIAGVNVELVVLEGGDYHQHRSQVSWFERRFSPLESSAVARAKVGRVDRGRADVLVLQSFDLLPGCADVVGQVPTIVFHDSTNIASYELERDTSPRAFRSLRYALKRLVLDRFYRRAASRVRCFLPRTRWCADSLKRHFFIPDERIIVCPAGLDLAQWTAREPPAKSQRPEVLFVGNDLERKGVDILLQCWQSGLADQADLVVVSNDPQAGRLQDLPGIKVLTGLRPGAQLREVFQRATLFVFPTRKDHMGLVLTEAAACGLPIIATDVGGVGEIARPGENGILMSRRAGVADWRKAIESMLDDPQRCEAMGRSSRALAERHLSLAALESRFRHALALTG